jgi:hypothetical protein
MEAVAANNRTMFLRGAFSTWTVVCIGSLDK